MIKVKSEMDLGIFKDLEKTLDHVDNTCIEFGFPEVKMHPEAKVPVGLVAYWNDQGTKKKNGGGWHIPPRPFMTDAGIEAQFHMDKYNHQVGMAIQHGISAVDKAFKYIGAETSDLVVERLREGNYKALSPVTIAQKNSDTLLIDTGFMVDSVAYKITKGEGE